MGALKDVIRHHEAHQKLELVVRFLRVACREPNLARETAIMIRRGGDLEEVARILDVNGGESGFWESQAKSIEHGSPGIVQGADWDADRLLAQHLRGLAVPGINGWDPAREVLMCLGNEIDDSVVHCAFTLAPVPP